MIRGLFIIGCLMSATQALGALLPDGGCPPRLVVQEETMDDGQITTTLKVNGNFFETEDQRPFRFDGSRAELFVELDKRAKHKRIIRTIAVGSAGVLLGGSIAFFRLSELVEQGSKKAVRERIMATMFVSSIIAGVSAPFIGDHGWRKYRDELEELFDKGELATSDRAIIKVLEHYLDATGDFEPLPQVACLGTLEELKHLQ